MEYTKEDLENLRKDSDIQRLAKIFDVDLDKLVDNAVKELEYRDNLARKTKEVMKAMEEKSGSNAKTLSHKIEDTFDSINKCLENMVSEGKLKCEEKDGVKYYSNIEPEKKKYEAPKSETQPFLMSEKDFEKFIDNYRELQTAINKIEYLFGINFDESGSGFSFPSTVNEIIWDFVRIIFGDENADDIADFLYGNSNFDSAKDLYEELV